MGKHKLTVHGTSAQAISIFSDIQIMGPRSMWTGQNMMKKKLLLHSTKNLKWTKFHSNKYKSGISYLKTKDQTELPKIVCTFIYLHVLCQALSQWIILCLSIVSIIQINKWNFQLEKDLILFLNLDLHLLKSGPVILNKRSLTYSVRCLVPRHCLLQSCLKNVCFHSS